MLFWVKFDSQVLQWILDAPASVNSKEIVFLRKCLFYEKVVAGFKGTLIQSQKLSVLQPHLLRFLQMWSPDGIWRIMVNGQYLYLYLYHAMSMIQIQSLEVIICGAHKEQMPYRVSGVVFLQVLQLPPAI